MNYEGKQVVICTSHRGVFFGTLTKYDDEKDYAILEQAQMCIYWPIEQRGIVDLAHRGPVKGSRVTSPAPSIRVNSITAILSVTPDAAAAWRDQPWM